jgi:hypothetical protein
MPTAVEFSDLRVGEPVIWESLTVFPLFSENATPVDYLLSDEAISTGNLAVEEISQSGSVPELQVSNEADLRVLFLEGEQLIGAKQNRMLNTSVLVAAKAKTKIPVTCVERGRWRYKSHRFASGGGYSPSKLRYLLKESVTASLKERRGHRSDQSGAWREIDRQQQALRVKSDEAAMADTFESHQQRLAGAREATQYVEGALGLAVAICGKIVSLDVFDKPTTCRKVWDRLLSGLVLDALEAGPAKTKAKVSDARKMVAQLRNAPWTAAEPVGEGREFRAEEESGAQSSALCLDGAVVHASLVTA